MNESQLITLQDQIKSQLLYESWQQQSLRAFLNQGLPTRKDEAWKYTDVSELQQYHFQWPSDYHNAVEDLYPPIIEDTYRIVFDATQNKIIEKDQRLQQFDKRLIITDLNAVAGQTIWQEYLTQNQVRQTVFTTLNAALMTNGLFVYVPPKFKLDKPLHFVMVNKAVKNPLMSQPRHLIIADEMSELSLLEEYIGEGEGCYFNNIVSQLFVKAGANVNHYKFQRESPQAFHIANTLVHQSRDSRVNLFQLSCGAKLSRDDLNIALAEPGAQCRLAGLYHASGHSHIDHHVHIDHRVPNCQSEQVYRGIARDKGHVVFNGKIHVHPNAQKTQAYQSNKNLLLSKQAKADTKPELEIYADDVQCTHGATVGDLDEKALFYLCSRGLSREAAKHLLTCAFSQVVLDQLPANAFKPYLQQIMLAQIATSHCLGECANA